MSRLADAFYAELPAATGRAPEIEAALETLCAAGAAAWPGIAVAPETFAAFVAARLPDDVDPLAALAMLPAGDLHLACACAGGDTAAIQAFERRYFGNVDAAVTAMRAPDGTADEVKQILRARFFVAAADRAPAVAEFAGRGDLHGWVRVSAVREILRLYRKQKRTVHLEDALLDELVPVASPELDAVKARCRSELGSAFRDALAALPARERTLLRYQVVDGLGISAIAAIHRVHRATAARWLVKIREQLVADTKARLAGRLGLTEEEIQSVIRLVRSQLEMSLISLL